MGALVLRLVSLAHLGEAHTGLGCTRVCRMHKRLSQLPFHSHCFLGAGIKGLRTLPGAWGEYCCPKSMRSGVRMLCPQPAGVGHRQSAVNELAAATSSEPAELGIEDRKQIWVEKGCSAEGTCLPYKWCLKARSAAATLLGVCQVELFLHCKVPSDNSSEGCYINTATEA